MKARVKHSLNLITRQIFILVCLVAILGGTIALPVLASTIFVAYATQDTYIQLHNPDANFNYADALNASNDLSGTSPDDWFERGILEMDISGMPTDATITNATLKLYYTSQYNDPDGLTVGVYKLVETDWVETEATWNDYKTGESWTTPGGDYYSLYPAPGLAVVPASIDQWVEWDITEITQEAYTAGISVELLLKFTNEIGNYQTATFEGFEYGDGNSPELNIEYTLPSAPMGNSILKLFLLPIVAIGIIIAVFGAIGKNPAVFFTGIALGPFAFIVIQALVDALL